MVSYSTKGSVFLAPLDVTYAASVLQDLGELVQRFPDAILSMVLIEFFPFSKLLEVSQAATSFANRGAHGNLLFCPGWNDAANDTEYREWSRLIAKKAKAELEKRKKGEGLDQTTRESVGEYVNYDSTLSQIRLRSNKYSNGIVGYNENGITLFGVNASRLSILKKRYDPGNAFRKGPNLLN